MKILLVHNYYQQPGGEDQVFADEGSLLEERGHIVLRHVIHNDQVKTLNHLQLAMATLWSQPTYRDLQNTLRKEQPDVVHFHNTFPLVSPSAYYAVKAEGIAVVQTLHNYRWLCPSSVFYRENRTCEDCMGTAVPWPAVLHACYRGSYVASAGVAMMLMMHRTMRTLQKKVDRFIALSEFSRSKFIQGGLPEQKVVVKPNFVNNDCGIGKGDGNYALFVGRLSQEKGLDPLLAAWQNIGLRLPLKIVGDGPLGPQVASRAATLSGLECLGFQTGDVVNRLMAQATCLVVPSVWYEGFPKVIVEAYGRGLPVVASDLGSLSSVVRDRTTGLLFRPGDPLDLIRCIEWLLENPQEWEDMRKGARDEFLNKYSATLNYQQLMDIYAQAMKSSVSEHHA